MLDVDFLLVTYLAVGLLSATDLPAVDLVFVTTDRPREDAFVAPLLGDVCDVFRCCFHFELAICFDFASVEAASDLVCWKTRLDLLVRKFFIIEGRIGPQVAYFWRKNWSESCLFLGEELVHKLLIIGGRIGLKVAYFLRKNWSVSCLFLEEELVRKFLIFGGRIGPQVAYFWRKNWSTNCLFLKEFITLPIILGGKNPIFIIGEPLPNAVPAFPAVFKIA